MRTRVKSRVSNDVVAAPARVLQRACACGESAGVSGKCPACAAEERLGVQPKLRINAPGDRWEREADRIADRVVTGRALAGAGPLPVTPLVQRQPEEEEEEALQAKAAGPAPASFAGPPPAARAAAAVATGGRPLAATERAYFEPRFGRDLSAVRIHDGAGAGAAARGINARAYTLGRHIAFAPGAYDSHSPEGRRLIAHELAHTLQQGGPAAIQRTCPTDASKIPAGGCKEFEETVDAIAAKDSFKKLEAGAKGKARHIIDGARASACPMYYIDKLKLLFETSEATAASTAAENVEEAKAAEKAEKDRLTDPFFGEKDVIEAEENVWKARKGSLDWRKTTRKGMGGINYRVDATRFGDIVVHMKVFPQATGTGKKEDVDRTKSLEDGIELEASTFGYTLDLEFAKSAGASDVFWVGVDPAEWTTSHNWVGTARSIAHEAHHLLGLEDRYNYIESHAGNEYMKIPDRLHWFREQMVRAPDPQAERSLMGPSETAELNEEDICSIAGGDFEACLGARFDMLSVAQLEQRGRSLRQPYRPENAAMLRLMSAAWFRKDFKERAAVCDSKDPICGHLPPIDAFGDSNLTAGDASKFPLTNPHKPPAGSKLTRKRRAPCPP